MNQLRGTRGDRMKGSGACAACRSFLWLERATFVASAVAPPDTEVKRRPSNKTRTPRMTFGAPAYPVVVFPSRRILLTVRSVVDY